MLDGSRTRALVCNTKSLRPSFVAFLGLCLVQMLSGCIVGSERPELALEIPPKYGAGQGVTAPPALDWWRGFRSRELTNLIEEAQGQQFELVKAYCQTILSAFGDVEIALIAITDGAERERLQQIVVTSSREAFRLAETRLREGTVDLVTVLQTQQTLFTAEDNHVVARLARLQAVLSLFQALGGSWMPPGVGAGPTVVR
jgi:outer membrane protein TolC